MKIRKKKYGFASSLKKGPDATKLCRHFKGEIYFQKGTTKQELQEASLMADEMVSQYNLFDNDLENHYLLIAPDKKHLNLRFIHPQEMAFLIKETGMTIEQVLTTSYDDLPEGLQSHTHLHDS